jgi:hypothetical protein
MKATSNEVPFRVESVFSVAWVAGISAAGGTVAADVLTARTTSTKVKQSTRIDTTSLKDMPGLGGPARSENGIPIRPRPKDVAGGRDPPSRSERIGRGKAIDKGRAADPVVTRLSVFP